MAGKPTKRRSYKEESTELDLTPMMNLIAILIPCLLVSVAFVELAVVKVAMPSSAPGAAAPPGAEPQHPPVNFTVLIMEKGYLLTSTAGLFDDGGTKPGLLVPVREKLVSCSPFLDTVPPPRSMNGGPPCKGSAEKRNFFVYDAETLTAKAVEIKDEFPDESRIIIGAEAEVQFEAVIEVMDAARSTRESDGTTRLLFEEVVLRPTL